MGPIETSKVLAKCAAFDQRTVGEADIRAWGEALGDLPLDIALEAVTAHYRRHPDRAKVVDILVHSRIIRERREARSHIYSLPSRFDQDSERDATNKRGRALCDQALEQARARRDGAR